MKRGGELAETRVKRKWQRRQQCVLRIVFNVRGDTLGPSHHVAMRQDNAFGFSGAARRVQDCRHIDINHAMPWSRGAVEQVLPQVYRNGRVTGSGAGICFLPEARHHNVRQIDAIAQNALEQGQTFR